VIDDADDLDGFRARLALKEELERVEILSGERTQPTIAEWAQEEEEAEEEEEEEREDEEEEEEGREKVVARRRRKAIKRPTSDSDPDDYAKCPKSGPVISESDSEESDSSYVPPKADHKSVAEDGHSNVQVVRGF
jgi:hypothetical protein